MAKKRPTSKQPTAALPPGIKSSTLPISPAVRKLIRADRGIASGGSNLARHPVPASAR